MILDHPVVPHDVHFRDEWNWQNIWLVRQRSVHEHKALADDSAAAGCSDGD